MGRLGTPLALLGGRTAELHTGDNVNPRFTISGDSDTTIARVPEYTYGYLKIPPATDVIIDYKHNSVSKTGKYMEFITPTGDVKSLDTDFRIEIPSNNIGGVHKIRYKNQSLIGSSGISHSFSVRSGNVDKSGMLWDLSAKGLDTIRQNAIVDVNPTTPIELRWDIPYLKYDHFSIFQFRVSGFDGYNSPFSFGNVSVVDAMTGDTLPTQNFTGNVLTGLLNQISSAHSRTLYSFTSAGSPSNLAKTLYCFHLSVYLVMTVQWHLLHRVAHPFWHS
jgi:hypothetical protein